ncbi:hypothetical protein FGIG_12120 [Fasciola gigantica]|uniref:Uncharacterized protein n=1 Tax=Fasciola gigantica TaxID=46835 RepID=A0A504Y9G1_FASGI|nr:hypothetical protein FGIG_12120 [Fasciola gigantica]
MAPVVNLLGYYASFALCGFRTRAVPKACPFCGNISSRSTKSGSMISQPIRSQRSLKTVLIDLLFCAATNIVWFVVFPLFPHS